MSEQVETQPTVVVKSYRYYIQDLVIEDNYFYNSEEGKERHTQSIKLKVPESSAKVVMEFDEPKLTIEVLEDMLDHLRNSQTHFRSLSGYVPDEEVVAEEAATEAVV